MNELLPYLAAAGFVIWVIYKLTHYPLRRCPTCKGSGNVGGGLFGAYKRCKRCKGSGEIRALFGPKT